jgi:hypothetical protein
MAAVVKVCGCRPDDGGAAHAGPAYANLQGRKPRVLRRYRDIGIFDQHELALRTFKCADIAKNPTKWPWCASHRNAAPRALRRIV